MDEEPREVFQQELQNWREGRRPTTWQPQGCQSEPKHRKEARAMQEKRIEVAGLAAMREKLGR